MDLADGAISVDPSISFTFPRLLAAVGRTEHHCRRGRTAWTEFHHQDESLRLRRQDDLIRSSD